MENQELPKFGPSLHYYQPDGFDTPWWYDVKVAGQVREHSGPFATLGEALREGFKAGDYWWDVLKREAAAYRAAHME